MRPDDPRGRDTDGDGFVDALCCNAIGDAPRVCGDDCNDFDRTRHPNATEACDSTDNDCDRAVDEGRLVDGFADVDRDRHCDPAAPLIACPGSAGFSTTNDDSDDLDPAVHGAQPEFCDGVDNNCNDEVDENATDVTWYPDADDDGFGDPLGTTLVACDPPANHSLLDSDCDDGRGDINPGATELCDRVNNTTAIRGPTRVCCEDEDRLHKTTLP